MNDFKDEFTRYKKTIIILGIVLLLVVAFLVYRLLQSNQSYEPSVDLGEEIPYINQNYSSNEYRVMTISDADIVSFYYRDFWNTYLNDPRSAWDLLTTDNKENKFGGKYDNFLDYVSVNQTTDSKNNQVERFTYDEGVSVNTIVLQDSEGYYYTFYEYGVWKYRVEIGEREM